MHERTFAAGLRRICPSACRFCANHFEEAQMFRLAHAFESISRSVV